MKIASTAALAILSGGSYHRTDLYDLTLTTGQTYHFTAGDLALPSVALATSASTFATAHAYTTGFVITRGSTTQEVGLNAQELELTFAPKWDDANGVPTIAGYTFAQAARLGVLDNATILYSKLFMNYPTPPATFNTSPGSIGWFLGVVAELDIKRTDVMMKISSNLLVLNQVQMPKNLYQSGCSHTVYDAGCTLLKSAFTVSGTVGTVTSNALFNTNLTQATDYFDLGVLTFTSGSNNGFSATVKQFTHTSGVISLCLPMAATVAAGDTFTIYPGCDHQQATCSGKFSNLAHFKGMPYTPVPETLYDGGTSQPLATLPPASQSTNIIGTGVGGRITARR